MELRRRFPKNSELRERTLLAELLALAPRRRDLISKGLLEEPLKLQSEEAVDAADILTTESAAISLTQSSLRETNKNFVFFAGKKREESWR